MNLFHVLSTRALQLLVRLWPAARGRRAEPSPELTTEAPVVVPVPRRSVQRSSAVIRSAMLRDRAGEQRLFTVLATCREGRMSFSVRSSEDCSETSRAALGLDAFERLLADAERHHQRFALHIVNDQLRDGLREARAAFPRIDFVELSDASAMERLHDAARERLRVDAASVPAMVHPVVPVVAAPRAPVRVALASRSAAPRSDPMRVGTDASKSRRRGVGVGVATEHGEIAARFLERTSDILLGELQAIEFALDLFPRRALLIESDSLYAVRFLTGLATPSIGAHVEIVGGITSRLEKTSSQVVWVRGHNGHDLNEAADRASRAARRQHEFGFEDEWLSRILGSIAEDCFSVAV